MKGKLKTFLVFRGVIPSIRKVFYFMTIYNLSKRFKWKPTNQDLKNIGVGISMHCKHIGVVATTVTQVEGNDTFQVKDYPETAVPAMIKILKRYWGRKAKRDLKVNPAQKEQR